MAGKIGVGWTAKMARQKTKFEEFISDAERRRMYERESLAFDAAELISSLMETQRVNKSKLAKRLGTTKSHVTQLLSGSRNMTMHTLAELAFALGCKVELKATVRVEPRGKQEVTSVRKPLDRVATFGASGRGRRRRGALPT